MSREHLRAMATLAMLVVALASCSDADLERVDASRPRDARVEDVRSMEDATAAEDAPSDAGLDGHRDADAAPDAAIRLDGGPPMDASFDASVAFDAGPAERWSIDSSDTVELTTRGGAGGSTNAGTCSDGHVLVGLQGLVATIPARVTLACSRLRTDGSLTPAAPEGTFGGSGDGLPFSDVCAPGEIVVGLHGFTVFPSGASDTYVNRLGISCVPLFEWAAGDDSHIRMLESRGDPQSGDDLFDERCPFGYALREINGRSGAFIDAVGGTCVRIVHEP